MNFWQNHGWLFLIAVTFFPRITMIAAGTISTFGPLGWIGWFIAPHLTVAILATTIYWHTNPVLCVVAWIVAVGGTSGEGKTASRITSRQRF
jgi:hypothetical protein